MDLVKGGEDSEESEEEDGSSESGSGTESGSTDGEEDGESEGEEEEKEEEEEPVLKYRRFAKEVVGSITTPGMDQIVQIRCIAVHTKVREVCSIWRLMIIILAGCMHLALQYFPRGKVVEA